MRTALIYIISFYAFVSTSFAEETTYEQACTEYWKEYKDETKFPEKFHFNTASKIYLGELLVNAEAPDISLLDNPNSNLYFNFGEYAKPSNFNRDLLINIEADGFFRPPLIFQPVVAKV